jgi:hypothetical protein
MFDPLGAGEARRKSDLRLWWPETNGPRARHVVAAPRLLPWHAESGAARAMRRGATSGSPRGPVSTNSSRLQGPLPLVGRTRELAALEGLLESGRDRSTSVVIVSGEGGVGKSRLVGELGSRAERRGWKVAYGRAFPVESGIPYALFSDAFLPILRELDGDTLTLLTRGGADELRYLFPALGRPAQDEAAGEPDEVRTRLMWNFAEFLKGYSLRGPLLVILEDLQWAD